MTGILLITTILLLGAAAAAFAALNQGGHNKPAPRVVIVAQPPASAAPVTPITPAPTTTSPNTAITPQTPKLPTVPVPTKTPKIPLTPSLPKTTGATQPTTPSTTSTPAPTTPQPKVPAPSAILLDTDAASTYNPYSYPATNFGDARLAIDGDPTTAWTAQVDPAVAPRMAEGLVIDLKTARRLSALSMITSSVGMTVEVYGANGHNLPASITDPAWVQLGRPRVVKNKNLRIKLRDSTKAFRFVTLWITKAPAASVGTQAAPGHVGVGEISLFPQT
jgi:hypothetical protein